MLLLLFVWHYSPWRTSASSKIVLHCSRFCGFHLQFLMSIFFMSSSTDSSHVTLGFPTRRVPSALCTVSLLHESSSCILKRCPSHLTLTVFITSDCYVRLNQNAALTYIYICFTFSFNPLNTRRRLLYLKTSSYRAVNTFHLGYKNRSVYDVSGTSRCLFSDKYKTHKHSVGRTYSC